MYALYRQGANYIIEDKVNPANFTVRIYSIKGLSEKYRKDLIQYDVTDIPHVVAINLINSKDNIALKQIYENPRLKGHQKIYIVRTKSGIPLGAYGGQQLAHRHAQEWADRTKEQMVIEPMRVPKK